MDSVFRSSFRAKTESCFRIPCVPNDGSEIGGQTKLSSRPVTMGGDQGNERRLSAGQPSVVFLLIHETGTTAFAHGGTPSAFVVCACVAVLFSDVMVPILLPVFLRQAQSRTAPPLFLASRFAFSSHCSQIHPPSTATILSPKRYLPFPPSSELLKSFAHLPARKNYVPESLVRPSATPVYIKPSRVQHNTRHQTHHSFKPDKNGGHAGTSRRGRTDRAGSGGGLGPLGDGQRAGGPRGSRSGDEISRHEGTRDCHSAVSGAVSAECESSLI